jgi:hypothetical protein
MITCVRCWKQIERPNPKFCYRCGRCLAEAVPETANVHQTESKSNPAYPCQGLARAVLDKLWSYWDNPSRQPFGPGAGHGLLGRMAAYQERDRLKKIDRLARSPGSGMR